MPPLVRLQTHAFSEHRLVLFFSSPSRTIKSLKPNCSSHTLSARVSDQIGSHSIGSHSGSSGKPTAFMQSDVGTVSCAASTNAEETSGVRRRGARVKFTWVWERESGSRMRESGSAPGSPTAFTWERSLEIQCTTGLALLCPRAALHSPDSLLTRHDRQTHIRIYILRSTSTFPSAH